MSRLGDKMFIAQETLELWLESGRVEFAGEARLRVGARPRWYALEPAVRILGVIEGEARGNLVGRVVPVARVEALGGEILGDSLVLKDFAFRVRPGYVATRIEPEVP